MTGWKYTVGVPSVRSFTAMDVPFTVATSPAPCQAKRTALGLVASTRPTQRGPPVLGALVPPPPAAAPAFAAAGSGCATDRCAPARCAGPTTGGTAPALAAT
jgi:hypothetical protein